MRGGPPLCSSWVVPLCSSWWSPFVCRGGAHSSVVGGAPIRLLWVMPLFVHCGWWSPFVCCGWWSPFVHHGWCPLRSSWWSLFVRRGWCPFVRCGGPPHSSVCGPTLNHRRWCTVSTRDPPCEQWLAGLGTGAGVWLMWWWCPSSSLSHHRVVSPSSRLGGQRDVAGVWARALTSYRAGDGSLSPLFGPW
jgi:hypothetical protein